MKPLAHTTILIAEDERPVRMLVRVVLEAAGARVIEAEHGGIALRLLQLHPEVDALCTDMTMPQVDGATLIRKARLQRPTLPIVACSALDVDESHPQVASAIDAIVQKPFVPSDLVRALDVALRRPSGVPTPA